MSFLTIYSKEMSISGIVSGWGKSVEVQYYKKGTYRIKGSGKKWALDKIVIHYGKNGWKDLKLQIPETLKFLKGNCKKLKGISKRYPEIKCCVDFPLTTRMSDKIFGYYDHIPMSLIKLCAELNIEIELSTYCKSLSPNS